MPRAIVFQVIDVAHRIDSGENIEFDTESNLEEGDFATKSKTIKNDWTLDKKEWFACNLREPNE